MRLNKNKKILIACHYAIKTDKSGGPGHDLREYLSQRIGTLLYMQLPFSYAEKQVAYLDIYKNNKKVKTLSYPVRSKNQWLQYVEHVFITWYFLFKSNGQYDLAIALDNLLTVAIYPFRLVGRINYLVFYAIDYVPKRFAQNIPNKIYRSVDQLAFRSSDQVWGVSKRMLEKRAKNSKRKYGVVPIGIHLNRIQTKSADQINQYELVFMGNLLKKQGVQIAIKSLPKLIKEFPKISLQIYGTGEYMPELKKLTSKLKLEKQIRFHGYVKNHEKLEEFISKGAIGIAPYIPDKDSFTYYADPSKLKQYIGAGLPVITTDISYFAEILEKNKAGVIMKYSEESFIKSVEYLLENKKRLETYKKNAVKLSRNYDVEKIMRQAFSSLPETK